MNIIIKLLLIFIWIGTNPIFAQTNVIPIDPWNKFYPAKSNRIEASMMKGKVKTIKLCEFEGESNFEVAFKIDSFSIEGVIQKSLYYEDSFEISSSTEYKYDSVGKLINEIHNKYDGKIKDTKYYYNEKGDLILKDSPTESIKFTWYSNLKKLKSKFSYNKITRNNSGYYFVYNKKGDLIEWKELENDTVIDRYILKYQKNNEVTLYKYYENEKEHSFYDVYYFNDKNVLSKTETYWGNNAEKNDIGKLHRIKFYEYDKYNSLIKLSYDENDKDLDEIFDYEYDTFGNWIKFTKKYEGEISTKIRKISYY